MSEHTGTATTWSALVNQVGGHLAIILYLLSGRPLPSSVARENLFDSLRQIPKGPAGDRIRDSVLKLLLESTDSFLDCKRIYQRTTLDSKIQSNAFLKMRELATTLPELIMVYNQAISETAPKEATGYTQGILEQMANLPDLSLKVVADILGRIENTDVARQLRDQLQLSARKFDELHDIIFKLPANHPIAHEALTWASKLAETFVELRLLVHSAKHLGDTEVMANTLSRMSRRSDANLDTWLDLLGKETWSQDEPLNLVIEQVDRLVGNSFRGWNNINKSRHAHEVKLWVEHVLDKMLATAVSLEELTACAYAFDSTPEYKERVLKRMLELI